MVVCRKFNEEDIMRLFNPKRYFLSLFCVAAALTMLTGCVGTLFSYRGAVVAQPNNRFALKEGDQEAVWKTNELAVTYRYQKSQASLKISGTVELLEGFATGFTSAKYLDVTILFLDKQGTVIENAILYSAGDHYAFTSVPMAFEKTISVPDGADSFSLGYDGVLVDATSNEAVAYTIGYFPR